MARLFKGVVLNAAVKYVAVPVHPDGRLFIDVQWLDITSAAGITLETTGSPADEAPIDVVGTASQWKTEAGIAVAGPAGGSVGSTKVHTTALCCRRARLRIAATANCLFDIYGESGPG